MSYFIKSYDLSPFLKAWLFPEVWCLRRHRRSLGLTHIKSYYHIFWGINSNCQPCNTAVAFPIHFLLCFAFASFPLTGIDMSVLLHCLVFIPLHLVSFKKKGSLSVVPVNGPWQLTRQLTSEHIKFINARYYKLYKCLLMQTLII